MNEEFIGGANAETAELADLQQSGQENVDLAHPQQSVDEFSDDEFLDYIGKISNGEVPTPKTEEVTSEEKPQATEPFRVFNTKEEYQKDFDDRFKSRFKDHKLSEEMEEFMGVAKESYGIGDEKALLNRLKQDMLNAAAAERGKAPEEIESEIQLKKKADAYDQMMKAEENRGKIAERWQSESESLKSNIPEFDFEKALQNPDFYKSIVEGKSVAESYIGAFMGNKKQAPTRTISQNASQNTLSSSARMDPSQMSDEEFNKYINRLKGN